MTKATFLELVRARHGHVSFADVLWESIQQYGTKETHEALATGEFTSEWVPSETWCSLTFRLPLDVDSYCTAIGVTALNKPDDKHARLAAIKRTETIGQGIFLSRRSSP